MASLDLAIQYIQHHGNETELARLHYLLKGKRPSPSTIATFFNGQRDDGGCAPFWAPEYSSIDAICYKLAQAEQLGLGVEETAVSDALRLLMGRQGEGGRFAEDTAVADSAPPWAKPGDLAAELYLTANAGYWLAYFGFRVPAQQAADYLAQQLDRKQHKLPSFTQTYWLAGGLWWMLGMADEALTAVHNHLYGHLPHTAADLAWMLYALLLADVDTDRGVILSGVLSLKGLQAEDGRFPNDSGQDVYTTVEAVVVFQKIKQGGDNGLQAVLNIQDTFS
jgi:hypothetical protein